MEALALFGQDLHHLTLLSQIAWAKEKLRDASDNFYATSLTRGRIDAPGHINLVNNVVATAFSSIAVVAFLGVD